MRQTLTIPGPMPGLNEFTGKGSRWAYTALKKQWGAVCGYEIREAKLVPMPFALVSCHWYESTAKRDPDNVTIGLKFLLDALVHAQVLPGDGFAHILEIHHYFAIDATAPRLELVLTTKHTELQP